LTWDKDFSAITDTLTVKGVYATSVYRVAFDSRGGSAVAAQSIVHGSKATEPATDPTRAGYTFGGWYKEVACTNVWNFADNAITSAVTIYAKWTWTGDTYTITFNANGGDALDLTSGETGEGWKLTSLPTPTKKYWTFDGWFTAVTDGEPVTIDYVYSGDATIYAQWTFEPTFVDSRDNTTYRRVLIGTQVWMAENLNYDVPDNTTDVCYNNSPNNCAKYGRLYDWATAMDNAASSSANPSGVQGACPVGWHLPSEAEWLTLATFIGGQTVAGTKLKSENGWNNNGNGTDDYGFAALPGGGRFSDPDGRFHDIGDFGFWWSASDGPSYADYRRIYSGNGNMNNGANDKGNLYSVRCVQD
jgi:uncharacterized protein (TIGR02145 family)/uncharacterized repeat protein (TIGR02543 family)